MNNYLYNNLINFISFNKLPRLFKSGFKDNNNFFNEKIDINQIFYSSLMFSSLLFSFFLFISILLSFIGFDASLILFSGLVVCIMFFYWFFSFPSASFRSIVTDELSR